MLCACFTRYPCLLDWRYACTRCCRICSNVMLSEDLRGSVGDLGTALWLGSAAAASVVGFSNTHVAPEVLLGGRCSPAADVYSLGILLIELMTLAPVLRRGSWRLPSAPHECPQVGD